MRAVVLLAVFLSACDQSARCHPYAIKNAIYDECLTSDGRIICVSQDGETYYGTCQDLANGG